MPVYRTPDGKIVEEKTAKQDGKTAKVGGKTPPPPKAPPGGGGGGTPSNSPYDTPTQVTGSRAKPAAAMGAGGRPAATAPFQGEEEKTRIIGGRRNKEKAEALEERAEESDSMEDPVAGWVVITAGPGKGRSLLLGYGTNTIGRGDDQRVRLDFGDDQISRENHALLTYDPKGRKFYVQHGGGTNLTYLGDDPVLAPTELPPRSFIQIGETTLCFIPFCGEGFDWQDTE